MSKSITFQFEEEYKPSKLRNWEIPKWFPKRPCGNKGKTPVISNERGHLLPGVPRSNHNPWGDFVGTWDLPKKIDRKLANELSAPRKDKIIKWKRHCQEMGGPLPRMPIIYKGHVAAKTLAEPISDKTKDDKIQSNTDECPKKKETVDSSKSKEVEPEQLIPKKQDSISVREQSVYVPGIFTDKQKRHASHYDLLNNKFQQQIDENKAKGYPKYREDFSTPEQLNKPPDLKSQVDEMMNQLKQVQNYERHEPEKEQNNSPYKAVVKNFILAKKLAKENLEHVPLPDTIVDTMYRKKQMQGDPSPGLVLKDGNYATGVGWKGYPGFGATRCTKLKVFRPKTSVQTKISKDNRPSSTSSFDIKWRFIRQQKVSPMDLAICWDMTPVNPNDEPKKPIHIDGSNGSQAPAVFSLVHTPKYEDQESGHDEYDCGTQIPSNVQRPEALFEKKQSYKSSSENSSLKRVKSAYNIAENCSKQNPNGSKNKTVQSTPDLTANSGLHCNQECYKPKSKQLNSRLCLACEMKNIKLKERPKSQYKMAFKAGVPNNQSREKRQDYPEHWRLATVYQHSYKPMHLRKKSLLRNVFQ